MEKSSAQKHWEFQGIDESLFPAVIRKNRGELETTTRSTRKALARPHLPTGLDALWFTAVMSLSSSDNIANWGGSTLAY